MKNPSLSGRSGVYRAPATLQSIRRAAAADGLAWLEVDLAQAATKADVLDAFASACAFPPTFGRNWDALADVLQDMSWSPAHGYVLHLRQAATAAQRLGCDWPTLLEVLSTSAMYWKEHGKAFVAFVDDKPELASWT
jgi:hypothetical protein